MRFVSCNGPSTVKSNGTNVFECYQGGKILTSMAGLSGENPSHILPGFALMLN